MKKILDILKSESVVKYTLDVQNAEKGTFLHTDRDEHDLLSLRHVHQ